jgi:tetraacyldisaccharide 4'-kinase
MRFLLLPFAILYGLGVRLRHFLYDRGWLSSKRYHFPIVCVGNLAVGGTGKTPMVEYLVRLLGQEQVAILSRGYRRKTRGFVLADDSATAMTLGDEPYQYHRKFPRATVAVCESRQEGIERLLENPHFKYIILDDAFQHRKVQAETNLLLTSYDKLYTQDFLLPVGSLRDIRSRAHKAQIIIVTKCPELTQTEQEKIIQQLKPLPSQKVYFTTIAYSDRVYSHEDSQALKDFIATPFTLVTGIANPTPLVDFLEKQGASFEHLAYSDHHHFSNRELELLRQKGRILTTEKDYVRLEGALSTLYYLPIETQFLNDQRLIFND